MRGARKVVMGFGLSVTCNKSITHTHARARTHTHTHTHTHTQSIGDSSQGIANAILYILFTKKVRVTLFSPKYWRRGCRIKCRRRKRRKGIVSTSTISSNPPIESEILTPSNFTDSLPKSLSTQLEGSSRKHVTIN